LKLQTIRPRRKIQRSSLVHPLYSNPPYGIFSRVARSVGVSPSFARKVALGINTSKRVATVLIAEADRIAKDLHKAERRAKGRAA
jgi:hypothetical protein